MKLLSSISDKKDLITKDELIRYVDSKISGATLNEGAEEVSSNSASYIIDVVIARYMSNGYNINHPIKSSNILVTFRLKEGENLWREIMLPYTVSDQYVSLFPDIDGEQSFGLEELDGRTIRVSIISLDKLKIEEEIPDMGAREITHYREIENLKTLLENSGGNVSFGERVSDEDIVINFSLLGNMINYKFYKKAIASGEIVESLIESNGYSKLGTFKMYSNLYELYKSDEDGFYLFYLKEKNTTKNEYTTYENPVEALRSYVDNINNYRLFGGGIAKKVEESSRYCYLFSYDYSRSRYPSWSIFRKNYFYTNRINTSYTSYDYSYFYSLQGNEYAYTDSDFIVGLADNKRDLIQKIKIISSLTVSQNILETEDNFIVKDSEF